jgi:hypothetical protein
MTQMFAADSTCAFDALGGAVQGSLGQSTLQSALNTSVQNGGTTVMVTLYGLTDLLGGNQPSIGVGSLGGTPFSAPGYDGTKDLDWWYTTDALSIDANRHAVSVMSGSISAGVLTATGTVDFDMSLTGAPSRVHMWNTLLRGTLGAASTPLASAGTPPGHLASEHLLPSLQSFGSLGQGVLCGNITAASLAKLTAPSNLTSFCPIPNATLLDLLVSGCTFAGQGVIATQPDQLDTTVLPGKPGDYVLVSGGKQVSSCHDKANNPVPLATCEAAMGYSTYMTFTADRVIAK